MERYGDLMTSQYCSITINYAIKCASLTVENRQQTFVFKTCDLLMSVLIKVCCPYRYVKSLSVCIFWLVFNKVCFNSKKAKFSRFFDRFDRPVDPTGCHLCHHPYDCRIASSLRAGDTSVRAWVRIPFVLRFF